MRELDPDCPAMIVTAFGTVETAVEAMKLGAFDFLSKPFAPEVVRLKVERALELRAARRAKRARSRRRTRTCAATPSSQRFGELVGGAEPMRAGVRRSSSRSRPPTRRSPSTASRAPARSWSRAPSTQRSQRAGRPVRQGQLRRARRDAARVRAVRPREGRLHRRHQAQARPLRAGRRRHAVPRRDRRHLAGDAAQAAARAAGARVRARRRRGDASRSTCASSRPPTATSRSEVADGPLPRGPLLPPARRADHHAAAARAQRRHPAPGRRTSSPSWRRSTNPTVQRHRRRARWRACCAYRWPGNVRELENVIEQSLVFAEGERIAAERAARGAARRRRRARTPSDGAGCRCRRARCRCPISSRISSGSSSSRPTRRPTGVKTETARLLGIKTSALYYKLEKYGIG